MRGRTRYRNTESTGVDNNAWLVTFSDLMTLLLTFFVLQLSMSSLDAQKLKQTFGSFLGGALGVLEYGKKTEVGKETLIQKSKLAVGHFMYEAKYIEEMVLGEGKKEEELGPKLEQAEVLVDQRGLVIRLPGSILFEPGSATLSAQMLPTLNRLAAYLAESGHLVRVEGHTDDQPLSSPLYRSNWELSMTRATVVLRYLIEAGHLSAQGFAALAYGDTRPIAQNDIEERRAKNRRVEVVLMRKDDKGGMEGKDG